jgi:Alpha amylase, catalytic domain
MRFPTVYQVNTRIVLHEVGAALGRSATLDDVPEASLAEIAARGFSWVWWLGVWQTGPAGREVARLDLRLRAELQRELPGLTEEDIVSSPFAVGAYDVHRAFGGDDALARLRARMKGHGLRLMLDFVPNHLALDHAWVFEHPEFLVHGSAEDLAREPQNYARLPTRHGPAIIARGRDPGFDAWADTVQLNHRHAGLRAAQRAELGRVAARCDGVRCDMAMLLEPAVFQRTWGDRSRPVDGSPPEDEPFWPGAITAVRRDRPEFLFLAEVYWDLEWTLQQEGFDFTYDKRFYDRLLAGAARPVREHLAAEPAFRDRCMRFLENHDEPRAALAFEPAQHRAAAVLAFLAPGLRLIHEGQLEGRRTHASNQLGRRVAEPADEGVRAFYARLLAVVARPVAHDGRWRLWPCRPAWPGNPTDDQFIVSTWDSGDERLLVVVNYGPSRGQCRVTVGIPELSGRRWALVDLLSDARHERDGEELAGDGLFLDLPGWGYHVFAATPL